MVDQKQLNRIFSGENMKRKHIWYSCILLFVVISGIIMVLNTQKNETPVKIINASSSTLTSAPAITAETVQYVVQVCGAVYNAGVYTLENGDRVQQAINCAGGLTTEAAIEGINQARLIVDGEMIYVPTKEELEKQSAVSTVKSTTSTSKTGTTASGKEGTQLPVSANQLVSINQATKEQLMTLPGVGEVRANQIIEYRKANGSFAKIEDIMKISGIKQSLFNKIKAYIQL